LRIALLISVVEAISRLQIGDMMQEGSIECGEVFLGSNASAGVFPYVGIEVGETELPVFEVQCRNFRNIF
jgi:hypothetical protein